MKHSLFFLLLFCVSFIFCKESKGYVYIITNPYIKNQMKIGSTKHLEKRIDELYTTGVVAPYHLYFAKQFDSEKQAYKIEKELHKEYSAYRSNPKREFFNKKVICKVKNSLNRYQGHRVTSHSLEAKLLKECGVKKNDLLFFSKDKKISVVVLSSFYVRYRQKKHSLKELTSQLLGRQLKYQNFLNYWINQSGMSLNSCKSYK